MAKILSFLIHINLFFLQANTASQDTDVQSKLEREASCQLMARLAFLALEHFSKDIELDPGKIYLIRYYVLQWRD